MFAKEKITSFIETGRTEYLSWSGEFYFSNGKLIDLETLGHGKSEIETWQPEQEMITAFIESKKDIERFKKDKKGD